MKTSGEAQQENRLAAQLQALQQRHLEWAQETAALLDDEVKRAQEPLHAEIIRLQESLAALKHERDELSNRLAHAEEETEQRLNSLSAQISSSIQEILNGTATLPNRPTQPPAPHATPSHQPTTPPVTSEPVQKKAAPVAIKLPKPPLPPHKLKRHRHLLKSAVSLGALLIVGYLAISHAPKHLGISLGKHDTGTVAGVSTERTTSSAGETIQSTDQEYPESFADVSFANTTWTTYNDPSLNFAIQYPKNASDAVHVVGSSHVWFLRKNGYLMKISLNDSTPGQTLDDWWTANQNIYLTDTTASKSTFEGQPAWFVTPNQKTDYSGSSYFIKHGDTVYEIWIKDEPSDTPDGQRIAKMLTTFHFLQ